MQLKTWLDTNQITPRSFALSLGVNPASVSLILNGKRDPSYALLRAIHKATKGDVGLLDWPDPTNSRAKLWKERAA